MLAWMINLGMAVSSQPPPPPPPATVPGGGGHRRGSIWEPSVALAILEAQEERRAWQAAQDVARPRPAAEKKRDRLFEPLETVQLALRRTADGWLRRALRKIEVDEQRKLALVARMPEPEVDHSEWISLVKQARAERAAEVKRAALAKEELEAAQAILLIMAQERRAKHLSPISDKEAAAILMNMLMSVRH